MADLIDRQAAFEALCNATFGCADIDVCKKGDRYCAEGAKLDEVPSAQPEIIRCKDCKWYEIWQLKSDYTDDKRFKPSVCVLGCYAVHRPEDWYCADAERRTDATD